MNILASAAVFLLLASVYLYRNRRRSRGNLPPGPPRLPLVGNLFNAPSGFEWKTYAEWSKKYGSDILYMNVLGTDIIILNTRELAAELLDRRSRIYSGRPTSCMAEDLIGCNWMTASLPYNDTWRVSRRLLAKYFSRSPLKTSAGFMDFEWQRPHVTKHTHIFLRSLLQAPDSFMDHNFRLAGSVSLSSAYGLDITPGDNKYVTLAQKALEGLKLALVPGRFLVDTFPMLRFAPEWVAFKKQAKVWKEDMEVFLEVPFNDAKMNLSDPNNKTNIPSMISQELSDKATEAAGERILQGASATVFMGGTSTTAASLDVFFLAMACHPAIQKRAQEEIDMHLPRHGRGLPTHDDLSYLPYCMAVVFEVLRWETAGPISIPHLAVEDDVYEGYWIPKNSIIIPNVWAMTRDPKTFPDPSEFRPERFLRADGTLNEMMVKEAEVVFGFGRRVCAGKSLGISMMAYAICCVLATFDVSKKLDGNGNPIEPRHELESAVTSGLLPFVCAIKPRSPAAEKVVLGLFE